MILSDGNEEIISKRDFIVSSHLLMIPTLKYMLQKDLEML